MLKQKFQVVPQGIIKSGSVEYLIDEKTGKGSANYDIFAGVWVFIKELKGVGAFEADPEQFKSLNVKKDKVLKAGDVSLTVLDVDRKVASVGIALQSDSGNVSGIAQVDISKEFLSIMHATVSGKVLGYDITLEIQPE